MDKKNINSIFQQLFKVKAVKVKQGLFLSFTAEQESEENVHHWDNGDVGERDEPMNVTRSIEDDPVDRLVLSTLQL